MTYERARKWLEEKHLATREDAENYLSNVGEDANSTLWTTVLDAIFPTPEIESIDVQALNALSEQQQQELSQKPEELPFFDRVGRFMRKLLRGEI